MFAGHRYPIKSVKASPLKGNLALSGSYDMNVVLWTLDDTNKPDLFVWKHHTEFV